MQKITINVEIKPEILDPQGQAILNSLKRLGLNDLLDVRQGKRFSLEFNKNIHEDDLIMIDNIAQNLLSNSVIENYWIEDSNES